ncbi:TPA: 23S rRNA (uracil(1939)-C(5))-methyltransferase RlmD [bacterium]|nr:23S rRNA (uracil(1939)-C(5))-methyltransferase RlmD [bacterium]
MKKGKIDYGFYKKGTHDIVSMKNCFLQEDLVDNILRTIKDVFNKHKLRAYDEDKKVGILRNVLIKRAFSTNETMVVLVTNVDNFPKRKEVVKDILKGHKEVKTIVQNINSRTTNVILGEKEKVLFGKGYIEDVLLGVKYRISAKSFYQVNPVQTEVLYTKAIELAQLNKKDRVIDAYCGIGSISLALAKHVKEVIGVEIVKDAVIDARNNAKYNDIKNANFILDDAAKFMLELSKSGEKIDVVFTDPPRKGCDQVFLDSLLELRPKKIIYISCNPSTLARDLLTLKKDYQINKVLPVDMFPQTHHIETIVSLTRK